MHAELQSQAIDANAMQFGQHGEQFGQHGEQKGYVLKSTRRGRHRKPTLPFLYFGTSFKLAKSIFVSISATSNIGFTYVFVGKDSVEDALSDHGPDHLVP